MFEPLRLSNKRTVLLVFIPPYIGLIVDTPLYVGVNIGWRTGGGLMPHDPYGDIRGILSLD